MRSLCHRAPAPIPSALHSLCWSAGSASPVHSHGGSQCFIKVLEGSLHERVFAFPPLGTAGSPLELTRSSDFPTGSVSFLNDDIGLHDISVRERAISLHVYIPSYDKVRNGVSVAPDCSFDPDAHPPTIAAVLCHVTCES